MEVYSEILYLYARSILEKLRERGAISPEEFETADLYNAEKLHVKTVLM